MMTVSTTSECGRAYSGSMTQQQQHIPPHSTQVSVSPESAPLNISTAAWMYQPSTPLPSTQLSTFVAETSSLDRKFTRASGFTTSTMSHSLDATADHLKHQEEENLDPVAGPPVLVPVLSLLAIIFILISILLYVLLKKRQKSRQHFQGKNSPSKTQSLPGRDLAPRSPQVAIKLFQIDTS
ncbi:C-X-C motif chemokine 16 [Erinaceus europaeus]|uniref:C-X-C motif chemokine 16 n=1 Tax=Erinaceus europaeus TaxID=9365 RepID=A0ABM3YII9_ERIEU|nr:C-X-C motif chemokine 16 [Erinaceus europaeus]